MEFYFVIFVIFGLAAGSAVKAQKYSVNPATVPLWINGGYGQIAIFIAGLSWLIGVITIFFQHSFSWMLISVGEVFLGAVIATFLPAGLNFLLLLSAPVMSVIFLGALWGFWYI